MTRPVPFTRREQFDACVSIGHAADRLGELPDRGLDATREVVDVAGLAGGRASNETVDDVADVNEVPRRASFIVELERQAFEGAVDERRRDVAPDRRGGSAPLPGAED